MRDSALMKTIEHNNQEYEIIVMESIPEYDIQDYDLFDEKDFTKHYLADIEKAVRTSFEYRQLMKYLRENMNFNQCSVYENVNNIDTFKIKIEIHHEPFTLFDIVYIVYNKRVYYHESLEVELVAKEVMYLHYKMLVGLIPLAVTPHELVHNQYLFIPMNHVMGNYQEFVDLYQDFIPPELMDTFERNKEYSKIYNSEDYKNILQKRYTYLDMSGCYDLVPLDEMLSIVSNKINQIKGLEPTTPLKPQPKRIFEIEEPTKLVPKRIFEIIK